MIKLDLSYLEYYHYQIGDDVLYETMYWWIIDVESGLSLGVVWIYG